jgi:hypothetical protein
MRIREFAIALALAVALARPAAAQQTETPDPIFAAERNAAGAALMQAEKLFNAGQRGPDSEPCKLMASYFLHVVKAAAAAGAKTRVADWSDLTWEEQNAVMQKAGGHYERNKKLREVACRV